MCNRYERISSKNIHNEETQIANTSDLVGKYRIQIIWNDDRAVTKH